MVITRTPLRVSFVGGGTDLPEYYLNSEAGGKVLSTTIDKYVYVIVNRKFDNKIRVSYSQTENVDQVEAVQHSIVRNVMKYFGLQSGWEIVTVADIPGVGSGLGSSSALTVGLIKAFACATERYIDRWKLAEIAYYIERKACGQYCGKQDQYASALGGFNAFEFFNDESVSRFEIINQNTVRSLEESLLLFYLGPREDKTILERQTKNTPEKMKTLGTMAMLAKELYEEINTHPCEMGQYLDVNWEYKRQLADGISNEKIQNIYQRALAAGANGGKVLGQGGGGFMLFHSDPKYHGLVKNHVGLECVPFRFANRGSEVIHGS